MHLSDNILGTRMMDFLITDCPNRRREAYLGMMVAAVCRVTAICSHSCCASICDGIVVAKEHLHGMSITY